MQRRRNALLVTSLVAAALGTGCNSVGPAGYTVREGTRDDFRYLAGRASRSYTTPTGTLLPVVYEAMEDLRFQVTRQMNEPGAVVLDATTADRRSATVTLRQSPGGTQLDCKVGLLGDEPLSRALTDRIAIRLDGGSGPETAVEATATTSTPSGNPYFSRTAVSDAEMLKGIADAHFQNMPSP